jgi:hypothetical protein
MHMLACCTERRNQERDDTEGRRAERRGGYQRGKTSESKSSWMLPARNKAGEASGGVKRQEGEKP